MRVVDTIVTEMAYIRVTQDGLVLEEVAPGLTAEDVQKATEARLIVSPQLKGWRAKSSVLSLLRGWTADGGCPLPLCCRNAADQVFLFLLVFGANRKRVQ